MSKFISFSSDLNLLSRQYSSNKIELRYYKKLPSHDRYIVIDNQLIFHSGHSFAELGNRASNLSRVEGEASDDAKKSISDMWDNAMQ